MVDRDEMVAAVLLPHFDAVRDTFSSHITSSERPLSLVGRVKFVVDGEIRDSKRHYAGTSEDGLRMYFAPEIVDLDEETLVAILCHEFGHAVDFLYPGRWISPHRPGRAVWIDDTESPQARKWRRMWNQRSPDQIEWSADGIAHAITGRNIVYCGDCVVQCFSGGVERPSGLR